MSTLVSSETEVTCFDVSFPPNNATGIDRWWERQLDERHTLKTQSREHNTLPRDHT